MKLGKTNVALFFVKMPTFRTQSVIVKDQLIKRKVTSLKAIKSWSRLFLLLLWKSGRLLSGCNSRESHTLQYPNYYFSKLAHSTNLFIANFSKRLHCCSAVTDNPKICENVKGCYYSPYFRGWAVIELSLFNQLIKLWKNNELQQDWFYLIISRLFINLLLSHKEHDKWLSV